MCVLSDLLQVISAGNSATPVSLRIRPLVNQVAPARRRRQQQKQRDGQREHEQQQPAAFQDQSGDGSSVHFDVSHYRQSGQIRLVKPYPLGDRRCLPRMIERNRTSRSLIARSLPRSLGR